MERLKELCTQHIYLADVRDCKEELKTLACLSRVQKQVLFSKG
jgi:hypothetical protein